jgi:hypothetical protein
MAPRVKFVKRFVGKNGTAAIGIGKNNFTKNFHRGTKVLPFNHGGRFNDNEEKNATDGKQWWQRLHHGRQWGGVAAQ